MNEQPKANPMEHTDEKTASLTIVREASKKKLKRADGHQYELHNVVVKGPKGEFEAVVFTDEGAEVDLGKEKKYQIKKGKRGEWIISEAREKKLGAGGYVPRLGMEVHSAALLCATDLVLSGKIAAGPNEIQDAILRTAKSLASEMLIHYRQSK